MSNAFNQVFDITIPL